MNITKNQMTSPIPTIYKSRLISRLECDTHCTPFDQKGGEC